MLLTSALTLTTLLALRYSVNALIVRGLRAPRVAHQRTPADLGLAAQTVQLPVGADKSLFAWYVPGRAHTPAPAVVVMHGWGANASLMLPALAPLHEAGFAVLLLDARCHGASDGDTFASLPRFAQDIDAGLDWLARQPGVNPAQLCVLGHSVGAGAALLCASRRTDIRAVVSLSAFAHPHEIMRRWLAELHIPYPVLGWYVMRHVQHVIQARFDDIAPLTSIARVTCPVLLIHGSQDELVPLDDARRLQAAGIAGRVHKLTIEGGHDPSEALQADAAQVLDFLQRSLHAAPPHPVGDTANMGAISAPA